MSAIIQHDGWWWPLDDRHARSVVMRDVVPDVFNVLSYTPERRVIVQAGGNVGVYPVALADRFSRVITFEPDPVNAECLELNVRARDALRRVTIHRSALGAESGVCQPTEVDANNCGANRVVFGEGDVPVTTIDSLGLEICDCIWLDLEGAEAHALMGAAQTIARCSPVISVEDKGLDERFFGAAEGAVPALLRSYGYEQIGAYGRDKIFRRPA